MNWSWGQSLCDKCAYLTSSPPLCMVVMFATKEPRNNHAYSHSLLLVAVRSAKLTNRGFIEDCLSRALKHLSQSEQVDRSLP